MTSRLHVEWWDEIILDFRSYNAGTAASNVVRTNGAESRVVLDNLRGRLE